MKATERYTRGGRYETVERVVEEEVWVPREKKIIVEMTEAEARWLWLLGYGGQVYIDGAEHENFYVVLHELEEALQVPLSLESYSERINARRTYGAIQ